MTRGNSLRTILLVSALSLPAGPALAGALTDEFDLRHLEVGQQIAMQGNAALVEIRDAIQLAPIALPAEDATNAASPWSGAALDDATVSHVVLTSGCTHLDTGADTQDI